MDACVENVAPLPIGMASPETHRVVESARLGNHAVASSAGECGAAVRRTRRSHTVYVLVKATELCSALGQEQQDFMLPILEKYAGSVQITGPGGFCLVFTSVKTLGWSLETTLRRMQMEILGRTGLRVSIGAGCTRTIARIALRQARPNELRIVEAGSEETFLANVPVKRLQGIVDIDPSVLAKRGIFKMGEIRVLPKPVLMAAFGESIGVQLWNVSRGRDPKPAQRKASVCSALTRLGASIVAALAGWNWRADRRLLEVAAETPSQG